MPHQHAVVEFPVRPSLASLLMLMAGSAQAGPLEIDWQRSSLGVWSYGAEGRTTSFRYPVKRAARRAPARPTNGFLDGPIEAHWALPLSGNWSVASNWSTNPFAPNNGNPLGAAYHAFLDNPGPAHTVTLNSGISLSALTLGSASATLVHKAGALTLPEFNVIAGKYELDGGALMGATVNLLGGTFTATGHSENLLSGVTFNGNFTLGGAHVNVTNGLTVNGVLTMSFPSMNTTLRFAGDQTVSGTFVMEPATSGHERIFELAGGTEVTFAPGSVLRGGGGRIGQTGTVPGDLFINQGLISADRANRTLTVYSTLQNQGTIEAISGGRLTVQDLQGNLGSARVDGSGSILTLAGAYTNTGLIPVSNGGALTLNGDWTNSGTITLTGASTLNLGGTFAPSDLGTINRGTGAVIITGLMQNPGVFTLDASTGSWGLRGGTIEGGTVRTEGGATLAAAGSTTSTLRNVHLDGTLNATSTTVRFDGNWSVAGLVTATNSTIEVGGSFNAASLGAFSRTGTVLKIIGALDNAGNTLTSTTAQGQIQLAGGTINGGTVLADSNFALGAGANAMNGVTLQGNLSLGIRSLATTDLTNQGVINLSGSPQSVLTLGGDWTNNGTINMSGGTLRITSPFRFSDLGTFNNTDGQVEVRTTFNNTGSTLNLSNSTAYWEFLGGTVLGGTLHMAGDNNLGVSGGQTTVFDGVTVNGRFTVSNPGSTLLVKNGLNLNGRAQLYNDGAMVFEGSQTFASGEIGIDSTGGNLLIQPGNTLTLGSGVLVEGGGGAVGQSSGAGSPVTLVNQGTIRANIAGRTLTVASDVFQSQGTLAALDGGRLVVNHLTGDAGTLSLGGSFTQMTLDGSYSLSQPVNIGAGATLNLNGDWSSTATITSAGTVNLNGSLTSSSFGAISGGTINLLGSVDNTGATLPLTTTWNIAGGSMSGGTVNLAGGARLRNTTGTGTLAGVTVNGGIDAVGGQLLVDGASTLNGPVTFNSGTLNYQASRTLDGQTYLFQGPGTLRVADGTNPVTLTLGSNMVVRGAQGFLGAAAGLPDQDTIINNGLVSADAAGGPLTIRSNTFVNNGTLEAVNGGTLQIGAVGAVTAWSNNGLIRLNNGTLNLAGQFTVGALGNFQQTNSSVNILGNLVNTGGVLNLSPTTGPWNLKGGTITGGTVNLSGGTRLGALFDPTVDNVLDGVTVNGELDVTNGSVFLRNGSSVAGARMSGGKMVFEAPSTTISSGNWQFSPHSSSPGNWSMADLFPYQSGGPASLTIAPGAILHGYGLNLGGGQAQPEGHDIIINNGTVSANVASTLGFGIRVLSDEFTNHGRLEAVNGGEASIGWGYWENAFNPPTHWTNTGVIEAVDGEVWLGGKTTTAGLGVIRGGAAGSVYLIGDIDNTGATLTVGPDLDIVSLGAHVHGGQIVVPAGFSPVLRGRFDNVSIIGDVAFQSAGFENGLTLAGVGNISGTFRSYGTQSLFGGIYRLQGGNMTWDGPQTLTIDPLATIDGRGSIGATQGFLINRGLVSANVAGQDLTISVPDFTNWGTLEAVNGGTLALSSISGPMNWVNRGVVRVGSGGTVSLGGTFSSLGGSLINNGGSLSVTGTLNNQGSVLTLGGATGDINLMGRIAGGTINAPAGSRLLVKGGRLDGVVLNGRADAQGTLLIKNNLTLSGLIGTVGPNPSTVHFEDPTNTLSGGTVVLNGPSMQSPDRVEVASGGTLTLGPGTTIRGGNGEVLKRVSAPLNHLVNHGTIRADQDGKVLRIAADDFVNSGVVEAVGGGILELSTGTAGSGTGVTWSSTGTLRADNGTLRLGGRFDSSSAAGIVRGGNSTVELHGRMNVTNLTLSGAANSWTLAGGAMFPNFLVSGAHIVGGTVNLLSGATFQIGDGQGAVFEGTTLNGDLAVAGNNWRLGARNSMEFNGTATFTKPGNFDFNPGSDLTGDAHFHFNLPAGPLALFNLIDTTFGPGVVVEGGGVHIQRNGSGSGYHFVNEGRITANSPASPIVVDVAGFVVNDGIMEAVNGGTLRLGSKWTNNGTLRVNGGNLVLAGQLPQDLGTIERTGGQLTLAGFVANEGSTFHMTQALGDWVVDGAAIKGGTISMHPSVGMFFRGNESILDKVSVIGDMVIDGAGTTLNAKHMLSLTGTASLTAPASTIMFTGPNALFDAGTIYFDPALGGADRVLRGNQNATLTLGLGTVVHGGRATIATNSSSTIINRGRISSDAAGETIHIFTERFQNEGVVEAINGGLLEFVPPPITAGTPMDFHNSGRFSPGNNALVISGDFVQAATGLLDMRIDGYQPGGYSQLLIGGTATLAGELRVSLSLAAGYGSVFQLLQVAPGGFHGEFDVLGLPSLPGGLVWNVSALYETGIVSIIPAPSAAALAGAGLLLLSRRRRVTATGGAR